MASRPSTSVPILAVLAIVLVTLAAYVGGYFWLGKRKDYIGMSVPSRVEVIERRYAHSWLAIMYLVVSEKYSFAAAAKAVGIGEQNWSLGGGGRPVPKTTSPSASRRWRSDDCGRWARRPNGPLGSVQRRRDRQL